MIDKSLPQRVRHRSAALGVWIAASLTACGGGGSNPFDNPDSVNNRTLTAGQRLAFSYFQYCIQPILVAQTCAASGCHDSVNGTGGALRLVAGATPVPLSSTADTIRQSDMYKNFYSAQGSSAVGDPQHSKLLSKPLVRGMLHGGGQIFQNDTDPNVKLIEYWISRPTPQNQTDSEFAANTYSSMFTPAFTPPSVPAPGTCNTAP